MGFRPAPFTTPKAACPSLTCRQNGSVMGVSVTAVGGGSRGFMRLCGPHNTMACSHRRHRVGVNGGIASGSISDWPGVQNSRKARRSPVV